MSTKKATKRALLTSILAICLCLVMLIGSTFAWFTDTASTSVNKIESGTLDLVVYYANNATGTEDGTVWTELTSGTSVLSFLQKKEGGAVAQSDTILWEPGCTYCLPALKIVNNGNLALKYKIQIAGAKDATPDNKNDLILLDVIDWTYKVRGETYALETEKSLAAKTGEQAPYDTLTIEGHMQETAGNDYQGLSIDGIAITVLATQDTVEYDSNSNQYDKNALYGDVEFKKVGDQGGLNDAITAETDKPVVVQLPANTTVTLDNGIANEGAKARNITFVGDGTQIMDVTTDDIGENNNKLNYQRGSSFTFENVTVQAGEGNFDGIVCDELTYKDCTIKGKLTLYGKATFINCTFENDMANQYSIWTWGGTDVTFQDCTFNTNGKAILLYGQATDSKPTNLVVNNCIFNDRSNGSAGKAAIEIGNDYNATYTLTVDSATVNGFADGKNTGSKLWANKNSMDAAHLTVTINGAKVQ